MQVVIDDKSGFCFGVVNAIARAEESLAKSREVWSLGDIVHNRMEVQRLGERGLKTIEHDQLPEIAGGTLLIRAHGEPPRTYREAEQLGIRIIDATCPVVAHLQRQVAAAYEKMRKVGGQVVILGKRGHAEVVGLTGQIGDDCIVVEGVDDLAAVDCTRPVYLLSQTTQSLDLFRRIGEELRRRAVDPASVTVHDTICRRVANREEHLKAFARRFDVVIFVCGGKSSNGRVLYEVCRSANSRSYKIEDRDELRPEWFIGCESVGVCGATSTPLWLMERVARAISEVEKQEASDELGTKGSR